MGCGGDKREKGLGNVIRSGEAGMEGEGGLVGHPGERAVGVEGGEGVVDRESVDWGARDVMEAIGVFLEARCVVCCGGGGVGGGIRHEVRAGVGAREGVKGVGALGGGACVCCGGSGGRGSIRHEVGIGVGVGERIK